MDKICFCLEMLCLLHCSPLHHPIILLLTFLTYVQDSPAYLYRLQLCIHYLPTIICVKCIWFNIYASGLFYGKTCLMFFICNPSSILEIALLQSASVIHFMSAINHTWNDCIWFLLCLFPLLWFCIENLVLYTGDG